MCKILSDPTETEPLRSDTLRDEAKEDVGVGNKAEQGEKKPLLDCL